MTYEQIRERWGDKEETAAKILAMRYGLGFYLWPGYKGWCRRFPDGNSDAASPSITVVWKALEKADAARVKAEDELREVSEALRVATFDETIAHPGE
jgi:hypothetical protein